VNSIQRSLTFPASPKVPVELHFADSAHNGVNTTIEGLRYRLFTWRGLTGVGIKNAGKDRGDAAGRGSELRVACYLQ
jgi:hypothetical protein